MASNTKPVEMFASDPQEHDYQAARDFLSLTHDPEVAEVIAQALQMASTVRVYKAKDILRASGERPLGRKDGHVRADLDKIAQGEKLSPVLLVRDTARVVVVIVDGFHRVCASRLVDENVVIPCRIVTTPW